MPCIDEIVDMRTELKLQMQQTANNASICDELKLQMQQTANNASICDILRPKPIPHYPPESGAIVLGAIGAALALSNSGKRTRYSGTCPHCGAPVDAETRKCAYCDCYYD